MDGYMKKWALPFVVIITVSLFASAPVAADGPEQSDTCEEAPQLTEGVYTGQLTPEGYNLFRLDLDQGEYVTLTVEFDETDLDHIEMPTGPGDAEDSDAYGDHSEGDYNSDYNPTEETYSGVYYGGFDDGGEVEIWAEEPPICLQLESENGNGGSYTISVSAVNENEPPEIVSSEEAEELETEIDDLETENEDLEAEIDELETELENAEPTINVSVEPADQANFQVGGEMAVSVSSDNVSPSEVSIGFNDEEYVPTGGEAIIPIASAGLQTLSFEYGDTTETVSIDVADAETGDSSSSDNQDTAGDSDGEVSGGSGPGFGILGGLIAVLSLGLTALRQRKQ